MLYLCAVIEYDCDSNVIAVQFVSVILLFQNYVKTTGYLYVKYILYFIDQIST